MLTAAQVTIIAWAPYEDGETDYNRIVCDGCRPTNAVGVALSRYECETNFDESGLYCNKCSKEPVAPPPEYDGAEGAAGEPEGNNEHGESRTP